MGRKSKIDRLPDAARQALIQWLSDPAYSRQQAADLLSDLLDELGLAPDHPDRPAVDSVNRYAQRYELQLQRMRERTQVAEAWVGQFGRVPEGKLGQMVLQLLHGLSWEAGLKLSEGAPGVDIEDMPGLVKMLRDLSQAVERTERASQISTTREREIARTAAEDLARRAEAATGDAKAPLTPERLRDIVREVYGV